jgi:hypothetical protein
MRFARAVHGGLPRTGKCACLQFNILTTTPYGGVRNHPDGLPGINVHDVRIVPLPGSRPPFCSLPPNILHRIAQCAFSSREEGFRSQLMSWALVCKAWLPLLDIFYERLGKSHALDKPDLYAVVRTLERLPEKAKLIRQLVQGVMPRCLLQMTKPTDNIRGASSDF